MDWDRLKTFYHVASVGSISKAIPIINLSQSAITRQVQSLENSLNNVFGRNSPNINTTAVIINVTNNSRVAPPNMGWSSGSMS